MSEALPESLEHWANAKPDEVAIIEDDCTLTWREWNDLSNCPPSAPMAQI